MSCTEKSFEAKCQYLGITHNTSFNFENDLLCAVVTDFPYVLQVSFLLFPLVSIKYLILTFSYSDTMQDENNFPYDQNDQNDKELPPLEEEENATNNNSNNNTSTDQQMHIDVEIK